MVERWSINDLTKKKGFAQTSVRTTGSSRWSSRTPGVSDGLGFSARSKTTLNYDSEASELEMERKKNHQPKTSKEETAETLPETFKQSWGVATDYAKTGTLNAEKVKATASYGNKTAANTEADSGKSALERVASGVGSIGMSLAASVPLLAETTAQTVKDTAAFNNVLNSDAFQEKRRQMRNLIERMEGLDKTSASYKTARAEYERIATEMSSMRVNTPLDENSAGMKLMGRANEMRQQATEGMSGVGAFAADTALSIGQTLAAAPAMVLGPAATVAVLGTQAAAQKAYEVQKEGGGATEALGRGVLSGSIEAATEKIPLDNLWDLVKSGGKGVLRNLLKQAGVEATEEGISYTANFIADKAAGDPNARFSVDELLRSAAAGGVSGLFFGGVGSLAHSQTQSGKPDNIPAQIKPSTALRRGVGRVTGTQEQFAQAYRAKRNPSATDAEVQRQYDLFKQYARGYDSIETAYGIITRQQADELFDRALEQQVTTRQAQVSEKTGRVEATGLFLNKSERLYKNAGKVKPIGGYEDFACHADPDSFYVDLKGEGREEDFYKMTPEEYAYRIKNSTTYKGGNVRIISCQAGEKFNGAAQKLADALGVDVYAPTELVSVDENGEMFVSNNEVLADIWYTANDRSKIKETGKWMVFRGRKDE